MRETLKAELKKNLYFCESRPTSEWQTFCDIFMGCQLLREWRDFNKGSRSCEWETETEFELSYSETNSVEFFPPYNQQRWSDLYPPLARDTGWGTFNHGKMKKTCSFEASRGTWHVEKVGPFNFTNPEEWHQVWFDVFNELEDSWAENGKPKTFIG